MHKINLQIIRTADDDVRARRIALGTAAAGALVVAGLAVKDHAEACGPLSCSMP